MTIGDTPEEPDEDTPEERNIAFIKELADLINRYSFENESDTPDFVLAGFMWESLQAFNAASNTRSTWYGIKHMPGGSQIIEDVDEAWHGK